MMLISLYSHASEMKRHSFTLIRQIDYVRAKMKFSPSIRLVHLLISSIALLAQGALNAEERSSSWNQWRGPSRDGQFQGVSWPEKLDEQSLRSKWHIELPPSYSGPIVTADTIFVTGTEDRKTEIVMALERETGQQRWRVEWPGSMSVPFFAAANGSWIRATPAYDGDTLYVAGMKDVLVALDGKTGDERWRVDFVRDLKSPVPSFGCVSSPLIDEDFLYVQAGSSVVKLEKRTGKIVWRCLQEAGGMMGGAFSSPVIATLGGLRQLIVQTREKLAGVALDTGDVLWEHVVPAYRGMNILTPIVIGDGIFTSTYQNKSWLFAVTRSDARFSVKESWSEKSQGYMSTPVVVKDHVYIHLQNQRFACLNVATGERTWTSTPFGKYASLVAQGDQILALDQAGRLLLFKANPKEFQLLDERKVSDQETWAHLAVCDDLVVVRELKGLSVLQWKAAESNR
jgi:outer membrane protein assembly factor BamB